MINIVAIIVVTLIYMFLGAFWYSTTFLGKPWMDALGFKEEELEPKPTDFLGAGLSALFSTLILAFILDALTTKDVVTGLLLGVGLGLIGLIVGFYNVIWESKPWKAWLINSGYHLVALTIGGLILGLWQI